MNKLGKDKRHFFLKKKKKKLLLLFESKFLFDITRLQIFIIIKLREEMLEKYFT